MTNENNSAPTDIVHATLKSTMRGLFDAAKEFTDTQAIDIIDCIVKEGESSHYFVDECRYENILVGDFFNNGPINLTGAYADGVTLVRILVPLHGSIADATIITRPESGFTQQLQEARKYLSTIVRNNPSMHSQGTVVTEFSSLYLLPNDNSTQIRSCWIVKNNHMYTYIYWK